MIQRIDANRMQLCVASATVAIRSRNLDSNPRAARDSFSTTPSGSRFSPTLDFSNRPNCLRCRTGSDPCDYPCCCGHTCVSGPGVRFVRHASRAQVLRRQHRRRRCRPDPLRWPVRWRRRLLARRCGHQLRFGQCALPGRRGRRYCPHQSQRCGRRRRRQLGGLVDIGISGRVASVADGVSDGQTADATCQD